MEFYSDKKELTDSCYKMDGPWESYAKLKKVDQKAACYMLLHEMSGRGKVLEAEVG